MSDSPAAAAPSPAATGGLRHKVRSRLSFLLLRSCCCGCGLALGTKIIAVLSVALEAADVALSVAAVAATPERALGEAIGVVFSIGYIVVNFLLFFGAHGRRPSFLLPYLVWQAVTITLVLVLLPIGVIIVVVASVRGAENVFEFVIIIIVTAVMEVLSIYAFAVVYSLYTEFKTRDDMEMLYHNGSVVETPTSDPPAYDDAAGADTAADEQRSGNPKTDEGANPGMAAAAVGTYTRFHSEDAEAHI